MAFWKWYDQNPLLVLLDTVTRYEARFGPMQAAWDALLAAGGADPEAHARRHFQKTMYSKLLEAAIPDAETRARAKLARWELIPQPDAPRPPGPAFKYTERWQGERVLANF